MTPPGLGESRGGVGTGRGPVNDGAGAVVVADGVGPGGGACVPVKGSPGPVVVVGPTGAAGTIGGG